MAASLKPSRRHVIAGAAAAMALPAPARAQRYPNGPVQIIVAYQAGGGTDTLARVLSGPLSRTLGVPVTVQNVPGGGGQVAATTLLRDGGDGQVVLATNEPDLSMSTVFAQPPYRLTDFQVAMVDLQDPRIFLVQRSSNLATFGDFVERARREPRRLAVAVAQGSAQEVFARWLFRTLAIEARLVGYPGGGPAANALLAGDVVATIGDDFARLNLRENTRALFVAAESRSRRWPEAPTLTEAMAPFNAAPPTPSFMARYGVYVVPAAFKQRMPEAYATLQRALIAAREDGEFDGYVERNRLRDLSLGRPGEDFAAAFAADLAEYSKLR